MRTGTVSYKLEDLRKGVIIPIGMVGENDFTRVIFDAEEVFKKHPDAQVTMKVQPPKGGIYPATVIRDGNAVIWQVKAADVAHRGSGELQLTFTSDTMVEKSYIAKTDIKRSLVGNGPAPDPVQDWVDNAEEVLEDLEAAEVHQPIIGLDGYWYTWNQGTGEYEKTNTKAQGQDGHSPVLTSSKSGKTTTIFADGDQLAQILDGEDGQGADVIDDTAGEGDTDKTWSADKLDTEITDVKNDIQGLDNDKYEKPSGGIPATDMTEEVQNALSAVGKSEERDGIVQTGDTATRNITKDQYVIWKGNLYTALGNIALGETLSLQNLSPVSDGGFNDLLGEIKQIGRIKAYKKYVQQEQSTGAVWIALDEPVDIEEGDEIEILVYQSDKATSGRSWSNTASWNGMAIQNKARNSITLQDQPYLNSDRPVMRKIWKKNGYTKYITITNNVLAGFGVDFPDNFDSFSRVQLDPVSSTLKAGCTVEITVRKTI